jgi:uridine phosphorylase
VPPVSSVSAYGFDLAKVAPLALVVGDPQRASIAARLLQSPELIWDVREFRAFTGRLAGKDVTICSHGVGAPGAALVLSDLFRAGVCSIIRAGTCGSLFPQINIGTLVIASAAIREDGASTQILPAEFPAVANHEVVNALQSSARELGEKRARTGIVWSSALYYPSPFMNSNRNTWSQCGALVTEMEMALLFILAATYGARAGGILAVEAEAEASDIGSPVVDSQELEKKRLSMLQIALHALTHLS